MAITNARNDQRGALLHVTIANKHKNIASELVEILRGPDQVLQDIEVEINVRPLSKLRDGVRVK